MDTHKTAQCFSCGGLVPDIYGPVHEYILSSPGCWKIYGDLLSKEFDSHHYDSHTHRVAVNTYAVQHPGKPERRSIQSVTGHLLWLYAFFEKGLSDQEAQVFLIKIVEQKELQKQLHWLEPPLFRDTLNVANVVIAEDPRERAKLVQKWGESVWKVWKDKHYPIITQLAEWI